MCLRICSSTDLFEHIVNAICSTLLLVTRDRPHSIKPIEVLRREGEEIGETCHTLPLYELCEELLANALEVECSAPNGVSQSLERLSRAACVRATMTYLVSRHRTGARGAGGRHFKLSEPLRTTLWNAPHDLRDHISRL